MPRAALRPALLTLACLAAGACGEPVQGPGRAMAPVGLTLAWPAGAPAANAVFGAAVDSVLLIVYGRNESVVVDTGFPFPAGQEGVRLSVPVPVTQPVETLYVSLDLTEAGRPLFTAWSEVILRDGSIPPAPVLPLQYVGPGWDAVSLTISPRVGFVLPGGTVGFTATAINGFQQTVQAPVAWSVSDARLATIGIDTGVLTARSATGSLWVRAVTPTGITDSVQVTISTVLP